MRQNFKTFTAFWCSVWYCWFCNTVSSSSDAAWLSANLKLPQLFEYEDFDACRKGNPHFQYCVVRAVIQPDEGSDVWRNISLISADTRNFPHDHLERGLCLDQCLQRLFPFGQVDIEHIEASDASDGDRLKYLNRCVNKALQKSHNLFASSSISHCMTEEDFQHPLSLAELIFIGLVILLVMLVATATVRDFEGTTSKYDALIKPFSISRNVEKLLDTSKSDGNLHCLEGLRAIGMLVIIIVHSSLPMIRMPLKNTEDIELQTNSFIFPFVNSGNSHMIKFFFALGGMVLAYSFLIHIDKSKKVEFHYLWKKLLNRLARLVPAYAFIIFYQATLFKRTKQTPIAHKFVDYCSEHWWSNLLFINNYVHLDEPCLQYGWYLGADFQLFLVGMAIMALIWKFPGAKKGCVAVMVMVGLIVPGYVIYKEKLDATMTFNMRHALTELRTYKEFLKYYTPTQTNAGTYFFGMIAGMVYHHISQNNLRIAAESYMTKIFNFAFVVLLSLNGFLLVLPALPLERPSLFLAVYGSALLATWGVVYGAMFLLFAVKTKSIIVAFLEHPILKVMAKLSYSVYIVEYAAIYTIYSNQSVPISYGAFNSLFLTSSILFLSFISGLMLHLAVEVPCAHILKQAIDRKLFINRQSHEKLS